MARNTQLLQLVTMLRDEAGRANSVAVGVDDLPALKSRLRRVQETYYDEHDWPHLRTVFDRIQLQAGERYYDCPAELNFDRIESVAFWQDAIPLPATRGIGFNEYAVYDSENDVRADPPLRWDVRSVGNKEQIEVWPVPSTNDYELQFIGIRKLRDLIKNSDRADLDDILLTVDAASEMMKDDKEGNKKKALAVRRFGIITGLANANRQTYNMASGPVSSDRGRVTVRVSR